MRQGRHHAGLPLAQELPPLSRDLPPLAQVNPATLGLQPVGAIPETALMPAIPAPLEGA
jgi:hypothetical protein